MRKEIELSWLRRLRLKSFGYWNSIEKPRLPDPREYVDESWDREEKAQVAAYIKDAFVVHEWLGVSWCRFGCDENILIDDKGEYFVDMGTADMSDGVWRFPEGLVHYVVEHGVKPSESFLKHIRRNNYKVPSL